MVVSAKTQRNYNLKAIKHVLLLSWLGLAAVALWCWGVALGPVGAGFWKQCPEETQKHCGIRSVSVWQVGSG